MLRCLSPWVPIDLGINMHSPPFDHSPHGSFLNPSSGVGYPQPQLNHIAYHYYPPHLRDTPVNPQAKPILVLGDSFTFGMLLPWEHTYLYQLQQKIDATFGKNRYQLLNAATGGWGTADYLNYLEEFGSLTAPEIVIIFLNTDDIGRSITRDIYTLAAAPSLELKNNFHLLPQDTVQDKLYNSWLVRHSVLIHFLHYETAVFLRKRFHFHTDPTEKINFHHIPASFDLTFNDDDAVRYGKAMFKRIQQWCLAHHAKLLVITTGFNAFYPANTHEPTHAFLTQAPAFFKQQGIAYYDMAEPFKAASAGKEVQIPRDYHPNKLGAKIIADLSWPWIKNQLAQQGAQS